MFSFEYYKLWWNARVNLTLVQKQNKTLIVVREDRVGYICLILDTKKASPFNCYWWYFDDQYPFVFICNKGLTKRYFIITSLKCTWSFGFKRRWQTTVYSYIYICIINNIVIWHGKCSFSVFSMTDVHIVLYTFIKLSKTVDCSHYLKLVCIVVYSYTYELFWMLNDDEQFYLQIFPKLSKSAVYDNMIILIILHMCTCIFNLYSRGFPHTIRLVTDFVGCTIILDGA